MFDTIAGLPLHPLVIHATEVIVPVAAIVVTVAAVWPRFRRQTGYLSLSLALAALALVPLSTQSGEALEKRVGESSLVEIHANLADGLLPWVVGLVVVAALLLWWNRNERQTATARAPRGVALGLAVAAVLATTGTTVQAIRVGHSGATAVWSEDMSTTPAADNG